MKQLSLLILAGLTAGCFAAEQERSKASCIALIEMMYDDAGYKNASIAKLTNATSLEDAYAVLGFSDCVQNADLLERVQRDPLLEFEYLVIVSNLQKHAHRLSGVSSIRSAIARDNAKQTNKQAFLKKTKYVEEDDELSNDSLDDNIARTEAFHANLKEAEGHLNLIK